MQRTWFWPVANTVAVIGVITVNALANLLPLNGQSTGEIINRDPVRFLPAGWVFSTVWSLIYVGLVLFAAYGFSRDGRSSRLVRRVSPLFLLSCVANATWLFLWHWQRLELSMVAMLVLLLSLTGIYWWALRGDKGATPGRFELIAVWVPFSVYLSWISVATIANAAVTLDRAGWSAWSLSDVTWATILVAAAAVLALGFAARGDAAYAVVFVVAAVGIATRQSDATVLARTAWVAVTLVTTAMVMSVVRSSDAGPRRRSRLVAVP